MNKQSNSNRAKSFAKVFLFIFLVMGSLASSAQSKESEDTTGKAVVVKYLGTEEDMITISVKYGGIAKSPFSFSMYNSSGELLYRDRFEEANFERKFKVPKEHGSLKMVIVHNEKKLSHSFDVYNMWKANENVIVAK